MDICASAVEIASLLKRESGALFNGLCYLVMLVEVTDGPAVRYDVAFEAPLVTDDVFKIGVATAGLAVCSGSAYSCQDLWQPEP